jgi:hypothetical protein
MIAHTLYAIVVVASLAWFGSALRTFSFRQHFAASLLLPKSARGTPVFETMAASIRFLGGMNGALFLFCLILLGIMIAGAPLFVDPLERVIILTVLGAAHFSQFIFNVPVLNLRHVRGEAYWDVLSGRMYFIFVMDAVQAALCALALGAQFIA